MEDGSKIRHHSLFFFQAEFNRRSGGHVGHASLEKYRRNNGKYWHNFVMTKGSEWERMNLAWFGAFAPEDREERTECGPS